MKTAIIVSKEDPAGMNIAECLSEYDLDKLNAELFIRKKESIFNEGIDEEVDADLFIFATKHQSAKGVHSLSCHAPGNFGKAEAGGKDKKLCVAPAVLLKEAFLKLNEFGERLGHEITLEVTHHGPYLEKPCMFIEIGSDEDNWKNNESGKVIAKVVVDLLERIDDIMGNSKKYEIAFGVGGLHYGKTFGRRVLEKDIAIGHICPKYQFENLDKEMILEGINRTHEKVDFVLLDWKGLGKEKQRIVDMLNELGLEFKRTDKI
ncbi:MAG: D-aminoacyl-tRNA deacylase [Candidatus Woesearchaeota archaeon]|jgi:D-aminoacyl-tRNA deacylase|nr:D-aminoacyl-tRNA deacylase [Candidatus Woesearchaeota archaeon]